MIRGTTPTHIFKIPFDTSLIKEVKITYAQGNEIILTKTTEDCEIENNAIKTTFTQEDTFKFDSEKHVQLQIRILTADGNALASTVRHIDVERCLDDEVLA